MNVPVNAFPSGNHSRPYNSSRLSAYGLATTSGIQFYRPFHSPAPELFGLTSSAAASRCPAVAHRPKPIASRTSISKSRDTHTPDNKTASQERRARARPAQRVGSVDTRCTGPGGQWRGDLLACRHRATGADPSSMQLWIAPATGCVRSRTWTRFTPRAPRAARRHWRAPGPRPQPAARCCRTCGPEQFWSVASRRRPD